MKLITTEEILKLFTKEFEDRINLCIRPDGTFDSTGRIIMRQFFEESLEDAISKMRESTIEEVEKKVEEESVRNE